MAKLIVKPTINWLSVFSDARLITGVGAILAAMKGNPNYLNPSPSLTTVGDAYGAFELAVIAASNGGKVLTFSKNARRAELVSLVRQLAAYVSAACNGDYVKLLSSAFPAHKTRRERIGPLRIPRTPVLTRGGLSGKLNAATRPVRGAYLYTWTLANAANPKQVLQTEQTTGTKISFYGLTAGEIYIVTVNVVGFAGASDWSGPGRLMVV